MTAEKTSDVGQTLTGTTWGSPVEGRYSDYKNGRFAWFKQAKFGIFIHWGVYSLLEGEWKGEEYRGIAEWIMRKLEIPVKEYDRIASAFDPQNFDASEWADIFDRAGAQYVTITAKHHDGYALFDSDASDFNVVDASEYGEDIIDELADACRGNGLRYCLYYSQDQDWHEPQGGGNDWDYSPQMRTEKGRKQYLNGKVLPQIEELLTQYGPIGYIWFDTPGYLSEEEGLLIKRTVTECQPECMCSSRLGHGLGDFESLPDQMVPRSVSAHRCETAMTHNDSWAYSKFDQNWKSPDTLIQQLVQTVSCGANYLLNVGPRQDGTIPQKSVRALERIGEWLDVNGESIYGAQPNPLGAPMPWGVCTARTGKIYMHVMNRPTDGQLVVPLGERIKSAVVLDGGESLTFCRGEDGFLVINLPEQLPDPAVSVIVLDRKMEDERSHLVLSNQTNTLRASDFEPGPGADFESVRWMHETFGNWHHREVLHFERAGSRVECAVRARLAGEYRLLMEYDFGPIDGVANRHTLEGRDSVDAANSEKWKGVFAVDENEHEVTLPPIEPGYFELRTACSRLIEIPEGHHHLSLRANNDVDVEVASIRLLPA